jgi:hypothetical protein
MSLKYFFNSAFICVLLIAGIAQAQNEIPNASFEMWSGVDPDFWSTFNANGDPNVFPSSDSYNGNIAARMEVISGNPLPPRLQAHDGSFAPFPVSQSYNYLSGFYKYFPVENDVMYLYVGLHGGIGEGGKEGFLEITDQASEWTRFIVPIIEYQAGNINQGVISFQLENLPNLHLGTYFLLDSLELLMDVTSVENAKSIPLEFELIQNYPNPFNPITTIQYSIPEQSNVTLKVFDVLGNEVVALVNEEKDRGVYTVNFDAANLSSGIYFYKLQAGHSIQTKKMLLLK